MTRNSHTRRINPRARRLSALLPVAALFLAACSGGDDSAEPFAAETYDSADWATGDVGFAADGAAEFAAAEERSTGSLIIDEQRSVILRSDVTIETTDVSAAIARVQRLVASQRGLITSISVESGADQGWAWMVVRVPPDQLDVMLGALSDDADLGRVVSESRSADDVTSQLVELEVRIDNLRESIATVRRIMTEAVDIGDVVLLEAELNRRQTDLEVMLARQSDLDGQVEMATVHLNLHQPGAPTPIDDRNPVVLGLVDGWSAMIGLLAALAYATAAGAPLIIAATAGAIILIRRRRLPAENTSPAG
jgi:hypothetical protein